MQLQALAKHFAADFAFVAVACGPKMLAGWLLDGRFAAGSELVLAFVEKLRRQKIDAQEGQLPLVSRPQAKLQISPLASAKRAYHIGVATTLFEALLSRIQSWS